MTLVVPREKLLSLEEGDLAWRHVYCESCR